MPADYWKHVARAPRHLAGDAEPPQVQIAQASGKVIEAELRDLSRQGCQVRVPVPMTVGEPVIVRIEQAESGFQLTIEGTVRWQRPDEGAWLVGCRAARDVDWESLGELFLNGILSTELP